MLEELQNTTYMGQEIDDTECFSRVPDYLKEFFIHQNGFIAFEGGFHICGCVLNPKWHSLGCFWYGELKLSNLFDSILPNDIPIGQDCFGDQYLIRENKIIKLLAESGDILFIGIGFNDFLKILLADPKGFLNIENIGHFKMKPGQLLSVFPPFCINSKSEISIKPIDLVDRILFLSYLSKQIKKFPDGTNLEIELY
jgi:hypothetical protein